MSVYVDPAVHPFGRMIMAHMWADTLDELLAMVDRIGVQRKWIQGHPTLSFGKHKNASWVHFDISKAKRALAVSAGAIETDRYGPTEHVSKLRLNHPHPVVAAHSKRMLDHIASVRAMRGRP